MAETTVTDVTFDEEVLRSPLPVLVDFFATWCGPCRMLAPVVEEIAKRYEGKIRVCKVDVDASPKTAEKYGIESIPTLIYFRDGTPVRASVGYVGEAEIVSLIGLQ